MVNKTILLLITIYTNKKSYSWSECSEGNFGHHEDICFGEKLLKLKIKSFVKFF